MDNSKLLREYVAFYGSYTDVKDTVRGKCDRCREDPFSPDRLKKWMSPEYFKPGNMGNGPYLCIDCARHFGLVW